MTNNMIFSKKILTWYSNTKQQDLPWQLNKTIYKVWLSEIMLQQTQVATVIPYYIKFIKKFPTVLRLAQSDLNEVLCIWSGLGYYKRAINLHKTAKIIVKYYNGKFPQDFDVLLSFPGIGRSTAGAILSLGLNKRYPILDGNIKRILIRYYGFDSNIIKKSQMDNKLWILMEQLIPDFDVSKFNQAMMNLGRLICTYIHPKCNMCPINDNCQFLLSKKINQYSHKKITKKKLQQTVWWLLLFIKQQKIVWLLKRSKEKIWQELFCFPEFYSLHELKIWLSQNNLHNNNLNNNCITLNHNISNIHLTIKIIPLYINKIINFNLKHGIWYNLEKPSLIGLPKPVSTILQDLQHNSK